MLVILGQYCAGFQLSMTWLLLQEFRLCLAGFCGYESFFAAAATYGSLFCILSYLVRW